MTQSGRIQSRGSLDHGNLPVTHFQKVIHGFFHGLGLICHHIGHIIKNHTADCYHRDLLLQHFIDKLAVLRPLGQQNDSVIEAGVQGPFFMHINTFYYHIILTSDHTVHASQHVMKNKRRRHFADGGKIQTNGIGTGQF